ncbi:MAG: O-antigen ligase family protein [Methyloversatilis discipulorum]
MASVAHPMTGSIARRGIGTWALILLGLTVFVLTLIFVGALAALLPWWFVISISAAPIFFVIAWRFPEVALVLLVAISFGLIPDFFLPRIPLAGGALRAEDLGLFGLVILLFFRRLGQLGCAYKVVSTALRPILLVFALVGISSMLAVVYKTAGIKDVFNEARNYVYWLYVPLLGLVVEDDRRFARMLKLIYLLAVLIALAMVVQSLTGFRLTSRGQFSELWTVTDSVAGITRSTTPGMFAMGAALIWMLAAYAYGEMRFNVWFGLAAILLMAGIVVGFGRGFWASIFLGFLLLGSVKFSGGYVKTFLLFSILTVMVSSFAVALKPELVNAVFNRVASVTEEIERGTSVGRRKLENQYAIRAVENNPLVGVGIGGAYKPFGLDSSYWEAESRYIHNTYLHAAAKFGVPGFLILVGSIIFFLVRSWKNFRMLSGNKAIGFTCFWVVFATGLVTAFTQPNWMTSTGVMSVAIAVFVSEWLRFRQMSRDLEVMCSDRAPV